jgi:hypothetical protein
MSIYGLPTIRAPQVSSESTPETLPAPDVDSFASQIRNVDQPGRAPSVDFLREFVPTFNDGRETGPEREVDQSDTPPSTEEASPERGESVATDAIHDEESGGSGADGQESGEEDGGESGGRDSNDGDSAGGGSRGWESGSGESGGEQGSRQQQGERGGDESMGECVRSEKGALISNRSDARLESAVGVRGDTFAAQSAGGSTRPPTRVVGPGLTDPASGELRAGVLAAGQRLVAERSSKLGHTDDGRDPYEADRRKRLSRLNRVANANAFLHQHQETKVGVRPEPDEQDAE